MASFAPPIRRGDFVFSSILHADPGNDNYHPRASTAELAALLRPEAPKLHPKGSKPAPTALAKDPAWHWSVKLLSADIQKILKMNHRRYSAQLIHYGLPVTKDKNAAKVRLLNAMNQFKLEVPAWIIKLEGELKKEWEAENRKLKKTAGGGATPKGKGKGAKSVGANGQAVPSSLGSALSQGVNINVNVSMGSTISMAQQLGLPQSALPMLEQLSGVSQPGQKTPSAKRKRVAGNEDESPAPKTQKKAASATKPKAAPPTQSSSPAKSAPAKKTKTATKVKPDPDTPARATSSASVSKSRNKVKPDPGSPVHASPFAAESKPRTTQTARKPATPYVKKEETPKSSPYASTPIKKESKSRGHTSTSTSSRSIKQEEPSTIQLSGSYNIDNLNVDGQATMTVHRNADRDIWWAAIDMNAEAGEPGCCVRYKFVIKMDPGPSFDTFIAGKAITLGWRMRNVDTGDMKFGSRCTGEATFFRGEDEALEVDILLRGVPRLGDVRLAGYHKLGPSLAGDLSTEWDEFRRATYGR